jgi:site-specific recombinase XerD
MTAPMTWSKALRSYLGYLEGTGKSAHTIQGYRSDLAALEAFLGSNSPDGRIRLERLDRAALSEYLEHLKAQKQRTNTRRRKVLTAHRFLRYLVGRKRLGSEVGARLPAPFKVERVPKVVDPAALAQWVRGLPFSNPAEVRNRGLFWTLLETGCQVSEVGRLRFEDFHLDAASATVEFASKDGTTRRVPVDPELVTFILSSKSGSVHPFTGFTRMGPSPEPITGRGIELLTRALSRRSELGALTPRAFRKAAVMRWHGQGVDLAEIRRRLGLKTEYAFRAFAPLFRANG